MKTTNNKMKIKICGLKEARNIQEVAALQPDFMGFIFYPPSPRYVQDLEAAVLADLPQHIQKIGVFVNESLEVMANMVEKYHLDGIQLHGKESPELCRQIRERLKDTLVIKTFSIASESDLVATRDYADVCHLFLFDTDCRQFGGSGKKFPWEILSHYHGDTDFLLSGGIAPNDTELLKSFHHPRAVGIDLNSRFEIKPGLKDIDRLKRFLSNI